VVFDLSFDQNGYGKLPTTKKSSTKVDQSIPITTKYPSKISSTCQNTTNAKHTVQISEPKPLEVHAKTKSNHCQEEPSAPPKQQQQQQPFLLESLLVITEGRGICDSNMQLPSHLYCVSRVFWSRDNGKTNICWNTNDPFFQFQQVSQTNTTNCITTFHSYLNRGLY